MLTTNNVTIFESSHFRTSKLLEHKRNLHTLVWQLFHILSNILQNTISLCFTKLIKKH